VLFVGGFVDNETFVDEDGKPDCSPDGRFQGTLIVGAVDVSGVCPWTLVMELDAANPLAYWGANESTAIHVRNFDFVMSVVDADRTLLLVGRYHYWLTGGEYQLLTELVFATFNHATLQVERAVTVESALWNRSSHFYLRLLIGKKPLTPNFRETNRSHQTFAKQIAHTEHFINLPAHTTSFTKQSAHTKPFINLPAHTTVIVKLPAHTTHFDNLLALHSYCIGLRFICPADSLLSTNRFKFQTRTDHDSTRKEGIKRGSLGGGGI